MKTYAYCRVSTGQQVDEGESLGVQERMCQGYAMMKGLAPPAMYIERGVSGSVPFGNRPEGSKLLAELAPGDVLIVAKIDRAFRSSLDALAIFGRLKDMPAQLHVIDLGGDVTGDSTAKLIFSILAAVAEGERDKIRERIRDVKGDQKKRGRYLGGVVPFGFTVGEDGSLVPVDDEIAAIGRARAYVALGESVRGAAARLQGEGIKVSHVTLGKALKAA